MEQYNLGAHHRRSIRLQNYDYSQNGLYFITICTHNRRHLFGEIADEVMVLSAMGKIVRDEWENMRTKYHQIDLCEYVIMTNHFHAILYIANVGAGFASPNCDENVPIRAGKLRLYMPTLGNMVAYFKYKTTKRINLTTKLWQRN